VLLTLCGCLQQPVNSLTFVNIFSYELFVRLDVILIPLRDQRQRNFCWVLNHTVEKGNFITRRAVGRYPIIPAEFQRYSNNALTSKHYYCCGCFFSEPQSFSLSQAVRCPLSRLSGRETFYFLTDKGLYSLRCLHCHFIHMLWWGIKFYSRYVAIIILAYATR